MIDEARVQVSRRFQATAEPIFDAWITPATASRFLFATPGGRIVRCEIDARPGGRYIIVDRRGTDDVEHVGEYQVVDRARRLVFTLQVPKYSAEITSVALDIAVSEPGGCNVVLTSAPVPPEFREQSEAGWLSILGALAGIVERH